MRNPLDRVHSSWKPLFHLLNQEPLLNLNREILPNCRFYPPKEDIFRVFEMPLQDIKVVILGVEPYYSPNQANGLAFSVNRDIDAPKILYNIRREVSKKVSENPLDIPTNWKTLEHWKEQGVFLLNTSLTVSAGEPGSHIKYWEHFISKVVNFIAVNNPTIWMMWGKQVQNYAVHIPINTIFEVKGYDRTGIEEMPISPYYNYLLKAPHPEVENYKKNGGFYGCDHFYLAKRILERQGKNTINW